MKNALINNEVLNYRLGLQFASALEITGLELVDRGLLLLLSFGVGVDVGFDFVYSVQERGLRAVFRTFPATPPSSMCVVRSDPSLYLSTHDELIPEFDETNSALDE